MMKQPRSRQSSPSAANQQPQQASMARTSPGKYHDTVSLSLLIAFGIFVWAIAITAPWKGAQIQGGPIDPLIETQNLGGGKDPLLAASDPATHGSDDTESENSDTQGSSAQTHSEEGWRDALSRAESSSGGNEASSSAVGADAAALGSEGGGASSRVAKILRSDQEWRSILSPEEFKVIREGGTEARGSSPLLREKRPGTYKCRACGNKLFSSERKYDSGTGWPSFTEALPGAVEERLEERSPVLGFGRRTEVTCSRCGAHLGHVFDDGPEPTHHRYCMNGITLTFDLNSTGGGSDS